ncbi:MAG: DUF167 domain-containing protein [Burkholderiales bacterium]|nr:DUF167 domain-containing protein [Burkholderiales bacterium]
MSREPGWWRYDAAARRLTLTLHVQPGARRSGFAGMHGDALKVRIAAPASGNRANAQLIGFLSAALDVPGSAVAIRRGATGRRKVVEISGGPGLAARIAGLV